MSDRPRPLISAEALGARIGDPALRLADVRWYLGDPGRGRRAYESGHLPGAIFIDLERDLAAPTGLGRHPLPDAGDFARRLADHGVGDEHLVVAYDDAGGTVAGRLWWMLDRLGHPEVAIVDGGLGAWQRAGGELSQDEPRYPPATLTLAETWSGTVDRAAITERPQEFDLVDLRAAERYRGEVEPVDPVAGHIPGARNRPATELLSPDGRLLEPGELAVRLASEREGPSRMVMSCGSGVTACFGALAARVAGLPDPLVYPGSYSDWSTSGMPIATGDEPGQLLPS